jgi:predicted nucleic acid-binding protein
MVYVDASVALAYLRSEDVRPSADFWSQELISSRLLEYETLGRLHATGYGATHGATARAILARVALVDLVEPVSERALAAFPTPVRTLDALHLACMSFLREQGMEVRLASYDRRLMAAANALGVESYTF